MPLSPKVRKNSAFTTVVAAAVAVVAAAFALRPEPASKGSPSTLDTSVRSDAAAVAAELSGLPITIYGDSLAATGDYYTPGHHWSELLKAGTDVGPIVDSGIGGSTMEQTTNVVGGNLPVAWKPPTDPTLVIVMSVLNSSIHPSGADYDQSRSVKSLRAAAASVAAIVLSDAFDENRTDLTTFTGDFKPFESIAVAGGSIAHALSGTVTFTVPPGYSGRELWMATLAGPEEVTFSISHNGKARPDVTTPVSEVENPTFSKYLLPIGKVDSGDTIGVINAKGDFWYDGMFIDNGKNHVTFATEGGQLPGTVFADQERNDAHNDAIRAAVDDVNKLVPDGASLLDLAHATGFDPITMTIADHIHPNDRGQQWIYEVLLAALKATLPITERLGA